MFVSCTKIARRISIYLSTYLKWGLGKTHHVCLSPRLVFPAWTITEIHLLQRRCMAVLSKSYTNNVHVVLSKSETPNPIPISTVAWKRSTNHLMRGSSLFKIVKHRVGVCVWGGGGPGPGNRHGASMSAVAESNVTERSWDLVTLGSESEGSKSSTASFMLAI